MYQTGVLFSSTYYYYTTTTTWEILYSRDDDFEMIDLLYIIGAIYLN